MSTQSLQRSLSLACAVAITIGCGVPAQVAQPPVRPQATGDPPGRVGRVAYLGGTVSFRASGDTAWAVAVPNSPVTTGDALWADNAGRVEVEIGSAEVRMDQQTELDVERLDDAALQFSIDQYNTQLVAGYSKNTANNGLIVFMPDLATAQREQTKKELSRRK